jgi:uncharacterized membrane protein YjjP (DUF1212 family)
MKPLLFIIIVTGVCLFISRYFSVEGTWMNYYVGGIAGFIVSGILLDIWNRRRRKLEESESRVG